MSVFFGKDKKGISHAKELFDGHFYKPNRVKNKTKQVFYYKNICLFMQKSQNSFFLKNEFRNGKNQDEEKSLRNRILHYVTNSI